MILGACDSRVIKALKDVLAGTALGLIKLDSPILANQKKILQSTVDVIFAIEEDIIAYHALYPKTERPILVTLLDEKEDKLPISFMDGICDDIILFPLRRPIF